MTSPTGNVSPDQVNAIHRYDDVDVSTTAHHHTLGSEDFQSSPGNHTHTGNDGSLALPGYSTIDHTHRVEDIQGFGVPTGMILMWSSTTASIPSGFLECDGAAVSRTTYATLFNLIGGTYGNGDGTTTFNLPNFTGRFPRGGTQGTTGGADSHSHSGTADLQGSHGHNIHISGDHVHANYATGFAGSHDHSFSGTTTGGPAGGFTSNSNSNVIRTGPHEHNYSGTTGASANHSHGVSETYGAGNHGHGNDAAGGHGHNVAVGSVSNVPAFLQVRFVIKT